MLNVELKLMSIHQTEKRVAMFDVGEHRVKPQRPNKSATLSTFLLKASTQLAKGKKRKKGTF